ncbi:MAG: hypothetical protein AAGJ91_13905 [Pseudomonadota bacterium]
MPLVWAAIPGFTIDKACPLPLVFLSDARDLRRHALAALDAAGREASITVQPDAVGLRAVLLAGLAATILPRPAVAPPLTPTDVALALPPLGEIAISVYRGPAAKTGARTALAEALLASVECDF